MSVKKSEKFIYLQNKAQHYDKLRHMKPSFRYSAPKSQKHKPQTIDNPLPNAILFPSKMPYFRRYDIEKQNDGLIKRVSDIMTSPRVPLIVNPNYSRYNCPIRPRSHLEIQLQKTGRSIIHNNQILATKVIEAKPSVGNVREWETRFETLRKRKRNLSKFRLEDFEKDSFGGYSPCKLIQHYQPFGQSHERKHSMEMKLMFKGQSGTNKGTNESKTIRVQMSSLDKYRQRQEENGLQESQGWSIKMDKLFPLPKLKEHSNDVQQQSLSSKQ